jgi:hypothetical protein
MDIYNWFRWDVKFINFGGDINFNPNYFEKYREGE